MATCKRLSNGNYEVKVYLGKDADGNPIRPSITYKSDPSLSVAKQEKEAKLFASKYEDDLKHNRIMATSEAQMVAKSRKLTFSELADEFFKFVSPYTPGSPDDKLERSTYSDYRQIYDRRIKKSIGHALARQISTSVVVKYGNMLREDGIRADGKPGGLSESTIQKDIAVISSILTYGVQEGYLTMNPLIYSGKTRRGKKKKEYRVKNMSIEDLQRFLWALDNPIQVKRRPHTSKSKEGASWSVREYSQEWRLSLKWRFYFYLAAFIGSRREENIALKWSDINFDTGEVNIEFATGYADGEMYQKDTKSHACRSPIVPQFVLKLGKQLRAEQMLASMNMGDAWLGYRGKEFDKNFIFIRDDGRQMFIDSPTQKFKSIVEIYNENVATDESEYINPEVTLHSLRHSVAAVLISNGMDPRSVADILGHSDPSVTLNIYSYFFRYKHTEAASIMTNILRPEEASESPKQKSVEKVSIL